MTTTAITPNDRITDGGRYSRVASWLHWLIGLAVIANIGFALLTEDMPRETHRAAMGIHKALGISILALTLLRIIWRLGHRPPPLPATMPGWERAVTKSAHFLFYALLILLPFSGWLWMSAIDRPVDYFGIFTVPSITAPSKALADIMHESHEILGLAMLGLAVVHIAAALKHQIIDRDRLLARINPF